MTQPHDRMYDACRIGWNVCFARYLRAFEARDFTNATRWCNRGDRWAACRARLLQHLEGSHLPRQTAMIPRSEITSALAQLQEAPCSPNFV